MAVSQRTTAIAPARDEYEHERLGGAEGRARAPFALLDLDR
ncbi:MAG: hypothetical protein ACR2ML_14030 [Solirubrobacteraceae bacterium]